MEATNTRPAHCLERVLLATCTSRAFVFELDFYAVQLCSNEENFEFLLERAGYDTL